MRKIILLLCFIGTITNAQAQFLKDVYKDFIKYGTVYAAGDISNAVEAAEPRFVLRTNQDGSIYSIPEIEDVTPKFPFDYRYSIGIRKLARFDYERKPKNFYDGNESQLVYAAPTSAIQGLEYQIHFENERWMGRMFKNHRFFVKHTGKYHIVKVESREVAKINLNYKSAEVRARLPIGKKFSLSAGVVGRGHQRAYGYNPFEIWLNEQSSDDQGNEYYSNPWYTLGFDYGYTDHFTEYTDVTTGDTTQDWIWKDSDGNVVANTDLEFREEVFPSLINRYNGEAWDLLDPFVELAPIIGFDFYHYKNDFWLHAFGNVILPYHRYIKGSEEFSYLNRNNWGKGGLVPDQLEQWADYSSGINLGWKIGKKLGVFIEGEYSKMWDSELFNTSIGLNYTLK